MKKHTALIVLLFSFYSVFGQGFDVDNYSVDIYINKAGYFDVVEKYDVNFTQEKHGIYRNILLNYKIEGKNKQLENRKIEISNIKVKGDHFETTGEFFGDLIIKIGDPDVLILGKINYEISYRVNYAFLFDDSTSYFYWNIRPSEWEAKFKNIDFRIHLPTNLLLDSSKYFIYSGEVGNSIPTDDFDISYKNGVLSGKMKENTSFFHSDNLTALIHMPKNYIADATKTWIYFWLHWNWIFYIVVYVGLFYLIWKIYGKETFTPSIIEYLPPNDIDPAMAGFLTKDHESQNHLISLIPYWGHLGYLKLEELPLKNPKKKADIIFTKLKELPEDAPHYQKYFFEGIFIRSTDNQIRLSLLANTFYPTMKRSLDNLNDEAQVFYLSKSTKVKNQLKTFLYVALFVGIYIFNTKWTILAGICFVVATIVLLILNKYMLKKNSNGNKIEAELLGYKKFIQSVDEEKIKTLLAQDSFYFEKTMSYALAFGMLDEWSKKFDSLDLEPPAWYSNANSASPFARSIYFAHSMSVMQSSIAAYPTVIVGGASGGGSFGGGGSSGGGFGGGGGGSW